MRVKEVKYIKNGDILASPIYTDEKSILIPQGAVLKEEYIDLLLPLGIEVVEIEDNYSSIGKASLMIAETEKDRIKEELKKILGKHIYSGKSSLSKIEGIAKELVQHIKNLDLECIYDIPYQKTDLYEHTILVTLMSLILGRKNKLSDDDLQNIAVGCLLHDLGLRYITVPFVNTKIAELPPTDIFEYKKHTILAYTVLDEESWLSQVSKNMILSHHEKLNGSGFPLKQKNQEMECRIIQLCDSFDCLISGMECERYPVERVMDYFVSVAGIKYDKELVDMLFSIIAKYPVGTEVELSDGKYGVVTSQTGDVQRPVVMLLEESQFYNLEENRKIHIVKTV